MGKQIYCCPKCGNIKASKENKAISCDLCNIEMVNTEVDEAWWATMSETDKQYVIDKYTKKTNKNGSSEQNDSTPTQSNIFKSLCKKYLSILAMICIIIGTIAGILSAIIYININKDGILMSFLIFIGCFISSVITALFIYVLAEILEALEIISRNTAIQNK